MYTQIRHEKSIEHAVRQRRRRLDRKNETAQASRCADKLLLSFKSLVTETGQQESRVSCFDENNDQIIPVHNLAVIEESTSSLIENIDHIDNQDKSKVFEIDMDENSNQSDNEDDHNNPLLQTTLHSYTQISTLDYCDSLLSFLRKSNINKSHSSSLLKLIKSFLPVPNVVPSTMEDLLSMLRVENLFTKRSVCVLCQNTLNVEENQCLLCQSSDRTTIAYVYDANIEQILKIIINRLSSHIEDYKQNIRLNDDKDTTGDIPFRRLYQQLLQQHPRDNLISLLLHLDGVELTKSTRLRLWMFSGSIVELPPKLRNRRHNMVILSIWIGYVEPEPYVWLKPIINQLKYLKTLDIIVKQSTYKLQVYGITGDCPALKKILNFIGHNGYDCCWFCRIHGEHLNGKRQYRYQQLFYLRTTKEYRLESREAHRSRSRINGHLGLSVIYDLVDIPLPHSIVIDYAHVTLLGHTKAITLDIYKRLTPVQRSTLDDRLKQQKCPHFCNRKLRAIAEFANVKSTELRNLLFYGLLPNLYTVLPLDMLAHLAMYVCSIRLLHGQPVLNEKTCDVANKLFLSYYEDHDDYYSDLQNYVLHLHAHYATMYINHGHLANIGCFGQEDLIGYVSANHHGTRSFGDLITYYFNIDFAIHNKRNTAITVDGPRDPSEQNADQYDGADEFHSHLCRGCDQTTNSCLTIYRRCIVHQKMFHSLIYYKRQNSVSYFVEYFLNDERNKQRFGSINYFFTHAGQSFASVRRYPIQTLYSKNFKESKYYNLLKNPLDHLFFVLDKKPLETNLVHTNCIVAHCIIFEMENCILVTPISSYSEHD